MLVILLKPHNYAKKSQGKHSYFVFNRYCVCISILHKNEPNISLIINRYFYSLIGQQNLDHKYTVEYMNSIYFSKEILC